MSVGSAVRARRALACLALAVAGCLPTSSFMVTLPGFAGDPGLDPLPVVLEDQSGFAAGLEIGVLEFLGEELPSAIAVAGDPAALQVEWLGGMCDERTTLTLSGSGGGLRLVIATDRANACRLAGIGRSIVIRFRQAIQPTQLEVVEQDD